MTFQNIDIVFFPQFTQVGRNITILLASTEILPKIHVNVIFDIKLKPIDEFLTRIQNLRKWHSKQSQIS